MSHISSTRGSCVTCHAALFTARQNKVGYCYDCLKRQLARANREQKRMTELAMARGISNDSMLHDSMLQDIDRRVNQIERTLALS